jgi:MFS family permease
MTDMSRQTSPRRELVVVKGANVRPDAAFFYGWWVVLACAVGLFWGPPVTVFCFPVFLKPLMQDFHAGRAAVSLGFTLHLITTAVGAPLVGWLIDRLGSRKVILLATAMFGSILLLNKPLSTNLWRFYFFNIALGLVGIGVGPLPYGKVVSVWFDRSRGLALGLMMVGIGSGAMIMPSVAQELIRRFGWHTAYAGLGGAVLLIAIPVVALLLRDRPQDLGLLPDGAPPKNVVAGNEAAVPGLSALESWSTATFWLMVCAFFLVSASVQGCVIHLAAMLSDREISPQIAALGSSLAGAAVLLGRVGTGYLLDRFFAPRVAAVFFAGATAGIGLLWMGGTATILFVGALFVGLGLGAEMDLIAYLISRYFGLRAYGRVYSSAFAAFALAGALGPLIMGAGFDLTGSYRGPLASFFAATLVATVLMTRLGPYRYVAGEPDGNDQIVHVQPEERRCGV